MKRYPTKNSKKKFRNTAGLQHKANTLQPIARGGTRL
jgi:hypothetical protein